MPKLTPSQIDQLKLDAEGLSIGDQNPHATCPVCHHAGSFAVKREAMGLLYNCLRDSCQAHGFLPTAGELQQSLYQTTSPPKAHPYLGDMLPLPGAVLDWLEKRFDLNGWHFKDWFLTEAPEGLDLGMVGMPVHNPMGLSRGNMIRRGGWPVEWMPEAPFARAIHPPKTKLYMDSPFSTRLHWAPTPPGNVLHRTIVLVEDQVSAAKVSAVSGYQGVAMLGTSLTGDQIREIATEKPELVVFAFDGDALASAFQAARKWGLSFKRTMILPLGLDLKDLSQAAVCDTLSMAT